MIKTRGIVSAVVFACMLAGAGNAHAQKTIAGNNFSITFPALWDTVKSPYFAAKLSGLLGAATMGANAGTELPNVDSLAAFYSDSLGGHLTKDSSGVITAGKYTVHWQKFDYDSLPKLSAMITKQTGTSVNLQNGSFRVYYLQADGFVFTIVGMALIHGGVVPYADIETALATLKLGANASIFALARADARGLWAKDGRIGGAWFAAQKPSAVQCFDARGAYLGDARALSGGVWALPETHAALIVRARTASGFGPSALIQP